MNRFKLQTLKTHASLWSVPVLGAALLTGATAFAAPAEKIVIRHLGYVHHGDPWHEYMDARIAEFEKLHPNVKIERVLAGQSGQGTIEDKFTAMVAGGIAPDVTEMTLSQAGGLAPPGVFQDLRPFFAKDASVKLTDFATPALQALTWADGTLWGMPMDVFPVAAYYNATLFKEAGLLTPAELKGNMWNWEYAMSAAKKLTRDRNGDGRMDQWGIDGAWALISYMIPLKQTGGGFYDRHVDPTRSMLTDPRTLQGFEWVAEIYRQQVNGQDYQNTFQQGLAGFVLTTGPTGIGTFNRVANFEWDVAPPLHGPANNGGYIAVNSIQMTRYSNHPDLAWEWMKFLTANRDNMQDFIRRTTRVPSYVQLLSQYGRLIGKAPAGVNHFSDVIMNPASFHPPVGPTTTRLNNMVFSAFMSEVVSGGKGVRTVMESLNDQVNAILTEGRKK